MHQIIYEDIQGKTFGEYVCKIANIVDGFLAIKTAKDTWEVGPLASGECWAIIVPPDVVIPYEYRKILSIKEPEIGFCDVYDKEKMDVVIKNIKKDGTSGKGFVLYSKNQSNALVIKLL